MNTKIFPIVTREDILDIFTVVCGFREEEAEITDNTKLKRTTVAHVLALLVTKGLLPPSRAESLQKNIEFAKMFERKTRLTHTTKTFSDMQHEEGKNRGFLFIGHMQDRDFSQGNCRKKPEEMLCRTPLQLTDAGKKFARSRELRVGKFMTQSQWRECYATLLQIRVQNASFAAKARKLNKRVWGTELTP